MHGDSSEASKGYLLTYIIKNLLQNVGLYKDTLVLLEQMTFIYETHDSLREAFESERCHVEGKHEEIQCVVDINEVAMPAHPIDLLTGIPQHACFNPSQKHSLLVN